MWAHAGAILSSALLHCLEECLVLTTYLWKEGRKGEGRFKKEKEGERKEGEVGENQFKKPLKAHPPFLTGS